jgi:hypothetical protein
MEILGHMTGGAGAAQKPAFTLGMNMSNVIRTIASVEEVRGLPQGSIVGDTHGGLTFSDVIASALEARSLGGWQEIEASPGDRWTIIVLNR